jgi:hypothetical protein
LGGDDIQIKVVTDGKEDFIARNLVLWVFDLLPRLNKSLRHHNINRNLDVAHVMVISADLFSQPHNFFQRKMHLPLVGLDSEA